MTSLDFLYIALGAGFLLIMIFLSVLVLHVTILLRDMTKIVEDLKDVSEKIKDTVFEPFKALSEMTAGLGFVNEVIEKVRARFEEHMEDADEMDVEEEKPEKKDKNRNGFFVKKLKK